MPLMVSAMVALSSHEQRCPLSSATKTNRISNSLVLSSIKIGLFKTKQLSCNVSKDTIFSNSKLPIANNNTYAALYPPNPGQYAGQRYLNSSPTDELLLSSSHHFRIHPRASSLPPRSSHLSDGLFRHNLGHLLITRSLRASVQCQSRWYRHNAHRLRPPRGGVTFRALYHCMIQLRLPPCARVYNQSTCFTNVRSHCTLTISAPL